AYNVKAQLKFTKREAVFLVTMAERHYDYTCQAAASVAGVRGAQTNGFIAQLKLFPGRTPVTWTWQQLDLTMKILEARQHAAPREALRLSLTSQVDAAMREISLRHDELNA